MLTQLNSNVTGSSKAMPTSSLIDYRPAGHWTPDASPALRAKKRAKWQRHNHSHWGHQSAVRYLDARGNLRRLADYDYTFRPAGPEHAVQQFVEATRIAGVRPESASLIHELASSHPRYASVRAALGPDEPAAEEPDDSMRWDPPLASALGASTLSEAGVEPPPPDFAAVALDSPTPAPLVLVAEPEAKPVAWRSKSPAERYERQATCASWSQAQLHMESASLCFGPAALSLSGREHSPPQRFPGVDRSAARVSQHSEPGPDRLWASNSADALALPAEQQRGLRQEEEEQAYAAWARAGRPSLALQKHQAKQQALAVFDDSSLFDAHKEAEALQAAADQEVARQHTRGEVRRWHRRSHAAERRKYSRLGWPSCDTVEEQAQELKLFADRQAYSVEATLTRCRAKERSSRPAPRGSVSKEAQEEMARQKQQMAKRMSLVRESLIASEGVLPSDKEVTAVLEAIEKGKKSLSPGKQ